MAQRNLNHEGYQITYLNFQSQHFYEMVNFNIIVPLRHDVCYRNED